ncbi:2-oxo-tetronate isomerase [Insolitispirillum peregrinum]|uniref:2-oxo-tetronate isomerase n=1 Tax=Insolitispirillum peregrinum TaxID=80876 RepID=UPI00361254C7
MPRFAANLSLLFTEVPFLDRFAAAAACGFKGCEIQFPYLADANEVGDKAAMAGLKVSMFNAPPGDWAKGERGLAAVPGRQDEFRESLDLAIHYADFLDCDQIHIMAGVVPEEQWEEAFDVYLENLAYACDELAGEKLKVCIEPINPGDMPGYFLTRPDDALTVLDQLDRKNLFILYDLYHAQITQGGITDFLEGNLDRIAHIQVAGVPGRNEPDALSELNYPYIYNLLDASGYKGWVGCEYKPRGKTETGLKWVREWLEK